jgi:hypothetical protein
VTFVAGSRSTVRSSPAPDADDFRIDIAEEHAADIRADVETRLKQALDDAMRDSVTRVVETVDHMATRLRSYRPAERRGDKTEGTFRRPHGGRRFVRGGLGRNDDIGAHLVRERAAPRRPILRYSDIAAKTSP